jgi:heterodisulfide reductase subunit C
MQHAACSIEQNCLPQKPDFQFLLLTVLSNDRVTEVEKEQRKEVKAMRTSETQELSSTVAQEMERKRKLAELKQQQV